jgi:hypothetical protein
VRDVSLPRSDVVDVLDDDSRAPYPVDVSLHDKYGVYACCLSHESFDTRVDRQQISIRFSARDRHEATQSGAHVYGVERVSIVYCVCARAECIDCNERQDKHCCCSCCEC